ncbi:hypothetical protein FM038_020430 [Shewanella eurypsychrophilus]|uniref:Holin n=1 Tax=Shewanella eurypsychrophilus TaxID=2593656 RepID=A0ABX6VBT6_9GAMM|nr:MULTISPECIES: hypothetical protein [Shewanella]QFU24282.1 hypothetical protein FS418_22145 [Shewanella sp. YLB-09]QPG59483.1 hypothetical protein FM038_020430 [Shewanella eurypsychrophilus]
MKFIGLFIYALQWLAVALSPTLIGVFIGIAISLQSEQLSPSVILSWTAVGFLIGGFWAEKIRKTVGLSAFFGRLAGANDTRDNKL